jgi:hypothetical protein
MIGCIQQDIQAHRIFALVGSTPMWPLNNCFVVVVVVFCMFLEARRYRFYNASQQRVRYLGA